MDSGRAWLSVVAVALITCAGVFYGGFKAAELFGISNPGSQVDTWRAEIVNQQSILDGTRDALQQNLDALALRLGQMNAHVVRLDVLGARLTQMAGLKDGEFDFTRQPSLGGPEEPLAATSLRRSAAWSGRSTSSTNSSPIAVASSACSRRC